MHRVGAQMVAIIVINKIQVNHGKTTVLGQKEGSVGTVLDLEAMGWAPICSELSLLICIQRRRENKCVLPVTELEMVGTWNWDGGEARGM